MRVRVGLLVLLLGLSLGGRSSAREGTPVVLTWDYAITQGVGMVTTAFQVQRCTVATCDSACTPTDLSGGSVAVGGAWGTAVSSGTLALNHALKTLSFAPTAARYVKLVALSEGQGNPYTSGAELNVTNAGVLIPQVQLSVVLADSQEFVGENGAVGNLLDGDTTTIWHTAWFTTTAPLPHTLIVDLGAVYPLVDSVTYLPRQDSSLNGTIADYTLSLSTTLTTSYTDSAVTGGESYRYQAVAVGLVGATAARSAPSSQLCTYVRARVRGRPGAIDE